MAGQLYDAWALLRVCLEQVGYAHYVGNDQQRWERWMGRHERRSRSQQDKWKDEFTHGKVSRHIRGADSSLGSVYTTLYERTIVYGAHPNERGISVAMTVEEIEDGGRRFNTVYLHGDGFLLDFLLKTTAQVGISRPSHRTGDLPFAIPRDRVQFQLETIAKRF